MAQARHGQDRRLLEHGGGLGPLIPNLGVSGDTRGLIPQGLGIDPTTGWIIQTSYSKDGDQTSVLSMVDSKTGREMVDVELGGYGAIPTPDHAGGVASDGKYTYVTSSGNLPTSSPTSPQICARAATSRSTRSGRPRSCPTAPGPTARTRTASSYVGTHHDTIGGGGNAYDGADDDGKLYAYVSDGHGGWVRDMSFGGGAGYVHTPPQAQGVVVRDGEYVFSTSLGRDKAGRLIVHERQDDEPGNGERGDAFELPYMSEGIIELDGEILTTYESGADHYGPDGSDDEDLWANPYMTGTSLEALGLSEDIDVDPESLKGAAKDLETAAGPLTRAANLVGGITVSAADLGKVSAASTFATAVNSELGKSETSLETVAKAVERTSAMLTGNARTYTNTDDWAADSIRRPGMP